MNYYLGFNPSEIYLYSGEFIIAIQRFDKDKYSVNKVPKTEKVEIWHFTSGAAYQKQAFFLYNNQHKCTKYIQGYCIGTPEDVIIEDLTSKGYTNIKIHNQEIEEGIEKKKRGRPKKEISKETTSTFIQEIPEDIMRKLKIVKSITGKTQQQIITIALEKYLERVDEELISKLDSLKGLFE